MKLPGSILWRASLVVMAALMLSVMTAALLLERQVWRPNTERRVTNFANHLKTISAALETMSDDVEQEFIRRIEAAEGVRVVHAGHARPPEGLVVAPEGDREFREKFREAFGPDTEIFVGPEEGKAPWALLWVRMTVPPHDEYWIGVPRRHIEALVPLAVVLWSAAGVAIAVLGAFVIIRRINQPLAAIAEAADRIDAIDRARPLPEDGPDEIRALAGALNRMMERLRRIERERATFLAGISHDLRTPLSHVQLEMSMLKGRIDDETRRDVLADLDDMNAILSGFIDFGRTEVDEACSPVDLSALARVCGERAASPDRPVTFDLAEVPLLDLRAFAFQRLVRNLVSNAVRHGEGEIVVRTKVDGTHVTLSVLDRGPGIAPHLAEHLKQPFTRTDDSRGGASGSGLGLAIADRVARLHGGRLDLLPREGRGLEARVQLPIGRASVGSPHVSKNVTVV